MAVFKQPTICGDKSESKKIPPDLKNYSANQSIKNSEPLQKRPNVYSKFVSFTCLDVATGCM